MMRRLAVVLLLIVTACGDGGKPDSPGADLPEIPI
jgi:hypothetical protein